MFVLAGSGAARPGSRDMSDDAPSVNLPGNAGEGDNAGRLCDDDPDSSRPHLPCCPATAAGTVDRRRQRTGRRQSEVALLDVTERKQAQEELERSHEELRERIAALDSLRADEQQRLAHEMHDDFGQLLAAMKMDICTLRQQLPEDDPRLAHHLAGIDQLVDAMVGSVRRIVAGLPPEAIEKTGLFSALESLIAAFEKRHGIVCSLHLSRPEPALQPELASAIYRMIQEALNNVAKHADAQHVEARVECTADTIRLRLRDDGCGIDPGTMAKPGAFGLVGMRRRASALGGEMRVESDGSGTVIDITIPARADGFRR